MTTTPPETKACEWCGVSRPRGEFAEHASARDGLKRRCVYCDVASEEVPESYGARKRPCASGERCVGHVPGEGPTLVNRYNRSAYCLSCRDAAWDTEREEVA